MNYLKLREELKDFYWYKVDDMSDDFFVRCTEEMDRDAKEDMSVYEEKMFQYRIITEMFEPELFYESPFYYETGTMCAHCDGARDFRGGHKHPGGWTYRKNSHLFYDQNPALSDIKNKQLKELFYLICGPYNDTSQHFPFNYRPVLKFGLRGIYEKAKKNMAAAETDEEKEFLVAVCEGMLCLKKMSEKFSYKAKKMAEGAADDEQRKNMLKIYDAAKRVPWEKPESFYEALNTYAFLRKTVGALEGVGLNTFGRIDMDLYPFYKNDIEKNIITSAEAYSLICKFLITFDMHYNHDMKMVGYADHELENTYVLGGCDEKGNPVYNELTKMFLTATREEKIIFPKIKCRYAKNSPKEYLDEIDKDVIKGTSSVLYQNDDAVIPALVRSGRTIEEARDYIITGCWGIEVNGCSKADHGNYVNMLKPFEYSLYNMTDKMKEVGMTFEPIDNAKSFEEIYKITCENINVLFKERARVGREGGNIWNEVDVLPIFSSTLDSCIDKRMDYTAGGAKYRDDQFLCFGLPNIVDSLLAIKELCYDGKRYSLSEMLTAVRSNWEGFEDMRIEATKCHGWGDGSEESCLLANRFNNDLYNMIQKIPGTHGGKIHLGHLTYTEVRWWGEKTLATPDGRKNGEYFAQGLTPSRLKHIPFVTSVVNSLARLDASTLAGNSVVNIILPSNKMTLDNCEAFLRAAACSAIQSMQLNCVTREELLDAQIHPEEHEDLIVRVTGFSAKFTSLSPEWQTEFITRNFYE